MQIANVNSQNFGQVTIARNAIDRMGHLLHKKAVAGESGYVKAFREHLDKCKKTEYADLIVTSNNKVFIKDKLSGHTKKMDSFNSLLNNVFNAAKLVIFAEENRLHF